MVNRENRKGNGRLAFFLLFDMTMSTANGKFLGVFYVPEQEEKTRLF
jgi:hypothetical protein